MDEYIKKETAYRAIMGERPETREPSWFAELVLEIPAADVVEVVRCRDCKFGVTPYGDEHDGWIECSNIHGRPLFGCNDFCSYGERKEGAEG